MKAFKITPRQNEIKESFILPELLIKKIWQEGTYKKDGSKGESDWREYLSALKSNGINSNDFFQKSFKEIETGTFIFKPDTSIPKTLLGIDKDAQYPIIYTGEEDRYVIEYEGVDGFINTYQMKGKKLIGINRYHSKDKKALFIDHVETEKFLFEVRKITKENPDRLFAYAGNIDTDELIPSDISNLISVGGYINISGSKFEKSLRFNSLEFIGEHFYYTDTSGGEGNMKELDIILPRVSKEDKKGKCIPMNNIEYSFYEGAELMNDSLAVRVNNKGEPEALSLFAPLFTNGLRKEMLWIQDLIQEVKKISPLYMVFPDKNNIPNNPKYIEERKHMVYMNRIEVVIKIPAGILTGNKNENYILITKPQSKGGTAKDILFMDLTKKFPDAKQVSSVINTFLKGQLHNSDTYYNAISKYALIEPYLLEPSLYV